MCENLCINFGDYINDFEGHEYYTFPTPEALSQPDVETKLRDLGFDIVPNIFIKQHVNSPTIPNILTLPLKT